MIEKLFGQYRHLKREIYVLFIGKVVTAMGAFVWPMLTFFLTTKLGYSDSKATLLIATAEILCLPAALLGGRLADHFSRKYMIVIFDMLTVALYTLSFFLPICFTTVVLVFLAGLFQTLETPAYDALVADFSTTQQREAAFSLTYLGYNLGFVVGASVSGLLFAKYTNLAFLLNGVAIFISTVLIFLFVHPQNAVGKGEAEEEGQEQYGVYEQPVFEQISIWEVLRERKVVLWVLLIGCLTMIPNSLLGILLPLQLKESMGAAGAEIYGYLNSLNGFTVILMTPPLTGFLFHRTEIPKMATGILLFSCGMALFAVTGYVWVLFVGMFIFTLGEIISMLGSSPYTSRRVPASHRGRIGGISSILYSLFAAAMQYAISLVLYLSQNNYLLIWLMFVGVGVVSAVLYSFAYRQDKRTFPKLYAQQEKK